MTNFEMYQLSAWSDNGLTKHVKTVIKPFALNVKKTAKNILIGGSLIAGALMTVTPNQGNILQVSSNMVRYDTLPQDNQIVDNNTVPIGYWPKLITSLNLAESVESVSTEFDPEPLV